MVLVGNKVDIKDRKVLPKQISFHRKKNMQYYDMSAKSNYNFEKPFLYLCKKLLNDPDVNFIAQIGLVPPDIAPPDAEEVKRYDEMLKEAAAAPLIDSDDEL